METYFKFKFFCEYVIPIGALAICVLGYLILLIVSWFSDRFGKR